MSTAERTVARVRHAHSRKGMADLSVTGWPAHKVRLLNPYTSLLYEHLEELGVRVDEFRPGASLRSATTSLWHIHWPDYQLAHRSVVQAAGRVAWLATELALARSRGVRVVWTVHNIHSHEQWHPRLEKTLWSRVIGQLDGYISLSDHARQLAEERHPALRSVPHAVVPHGHYRGVYPDTVSRDEARRALGIADDAKVFAFIGAIRPYKNVPRLVEAFSELADPRAVLLIGGKLSSGMTSDRIAGRGVIPHLRFIPAEELQLFYRAADLVVLPFADILNSGSAILGLSFDRPVLVSDKGAMRELRAWVGEGWVRLFDGSVSPSVLRDAMQWAQQPGRAERAPLAALEWSRVAELTRDAFLRFRGSR